MTLFTGSIPTIASGDNATVATNLATYRDALKGVSEAWTSYTPTWTSTGVAPAIGNGTLNGKWMQVNKLVHYRIQLTMGSTTTFGTLAYLFALPIALHADYTSAMHVGNGLGLDSGTGWNALVAGVNTSSQIFLLTSTNTQVAQTVPWTWAVNDKISVSGTYETA